MNSSKPWYASRGIWGSVLGIVLPAFALLFHASITDAQVQELATDAATIGGAVAAMIALYGRIKATKTIGPSTKAAPNTTTKGP